MADADVGQLIDRLRLVAHPEGGHYREIYRSATRVATARGDRSALTVIHFLLERGEFSAMHRLRSDETWHHISGAPITIETIDLRGAYDRFTVGPGYRSEIAIPAGTLFGASLQKESKLPGYTLVSCCVAPGFEFADFEIPARTDLLAAYPEHAHAIRRLTRQSDPAAR